MTATTTAPLATAHVRTPDPSKARLRAWATRAPLLPALIFMIVVTQLPFVATVVISFFDWNALYPKARHFTGVDNYREVLTDADLRHSVWTTVLLTVTVVLVSLVLGLLPGAAARPPLPGSGSGPHPAHRPLPGGPGGSRPPLETCALQP